MKKIITTLLAVMSSISFAAADNAVTQDNINYIITVLDYSTWNRCSKTVCAIAKAEGNGNGSCQKYPAIGVIATNLTTKGFDMLQSVSSCELVIEEDGEAFAQPRLGTSN
ncbi:MAG TPA: hypothetical protein VIG33_03105 [Pseudobdellovibrionaceae bacterium]